MIFNSQKKQEMKKWWKFRARFFCANILVLIQWLSAPGKNVLVFGQSNLE
jgi:hypothetical protein